MKIEFADLNDAPQVKQLLAECGLPHEDLAPSNLHHFLVVKHETGLAGVIGLELLEKYALLRSLAVEANSRGQGIASRLTQRAEAYALSRKVEILYLLTTTAESFFTKRGYQTVDRGEVPAVMQKTAEFRSICPSTAICILKYLQST